MFIKHLYVEDTQCAIRRRKVKGPCNEQKKKDKAQTIAHKCMEEMKNVHVFTFLFLQ